VPSCRVRPSVCLSVTFVYSVKMNKHIFKLFSSSGSQAILVFLHQTSWQYFDGNPLNGDVECRWVGRNRDSGQIFGYRSMTASPNNNYDGGRCTLPHRAQRWPRISESMFITTSMVDHDEVKRREQTLIVCSRKSEAELALGVLSY